MPADLSPRAKDLISETIYKDHKCLNERKLSNSLTLGQKWGFLLCCADTSSPVLPLSLICIIDVDNYDNPPPPVCNKLVSVNAVRLEITQWHRAVKILQCHSKITTSPGNYLDLACWVSSVCLSICVCCSSVQVKMMWSLIRATSRLFIKEKGEKCQNVRLGQA